MRDRSPFRSLDELRLANTTTTLWWRMFSVLIFAIAFQPLGAQTNAMSAPELGGGLRLRNISAYAAYYSSGLPDSKLFGDKPFDGSIGSPISVSGLGADFAGGGSAELGWAKATERANFSFVYTPSYTGRVRYSANALNHAFSLNAGRKFTPRLNFTFSVGADFSNVDQFLFAPTAFSTAASAPGSFDDLSGAMLSRNVSNSQLATVLSSAPLTESPARNLLYGERMLTSSAQTSLSYSWSPRLTLAFTAGGRRNQRVSESRAGGTQTDYLIPNTTSGNAGMDVTYSLSPITRLGGSVVTSRISSKLQDGYITTSTASLGRTFAGRWLLDIRGGVGVVNPVRQSSVFLTSTKPRPVVGGSLGLKTLVHTLLGSYDRSASDSYGAGAASTSSSNISWRWSRPGRSWWVESSFIWERLQGSALVETSSWRASTGIGRPVAPQVVLFIQYVYLDYSGRLQQVVYDRAQSAVRVSIIWKPGAGGPQ